MKPNVLSVRSHVSWLPGTSSTNINSAGALSSLGAYQNDVIPSVNQDEIARNRTYQCMQNGQMTYWLKNPNRRWEILEYRQQIAQKVSLIRIRIEINQN